MKNRRMGNGGLNGELLCIGRVLALYKYFSIGYSAFQRENVYRLDQTPHEA